MPDSNGAPDHSLLHVSGEQIDRLAGLLEHLDLMDQKYGGVNDDAGHGDREEAVQRLLAAYREMKR